MAMVALALSTYIPSRRRPRRPLCLGNGTGKSVSQQRGPRTRCDPVPARARRGLSAGRAARTRARGGALARRGPAAQDRARPGKVAPVSARAEEAESGPTATAQRRNLCREEPGGSRRNPGGLHRPTATLRGCGRRPQTRQVRGGGPAGKPPGTPRKRLVKTTLHVLSSGP